jgi:hypothetical protein
MLHEIEKQPPQACRVLPEIQQIALEYRRRYGYRRVTAELKRRGKMATIIGE